MTEPEPLPDRHRPIAEPEVHLIPEGFVGHVVIQHARADGAPAEREGDARLYRIPADGVVVTQAKTNWGIRPPEKMQYLRVSAAGARTPIPRQADAAAGVPCILGGYQVGPDFHYFVDMPENAGTYKNPALSDAEDRG